MHIKKHLSFTGLRKIIAEHFLKLVDGRKAERIDYQLHDCLMSALAMMFFQDPSVLAFQRRLEEAIERNNLKSVFNIQSIPSDTQLRDVIDPLPTQSLEPIFDALLAPLQRGKHLAEYQLLDDHYLIPIDGSQYFSSQAIHCPHCLTKPGTKGKTRYYHQVLQAAIVHPDKRQVLPLAPEAIANTDGRKKQDCEINAGKRLVKKIRKAHPKLKIIITADGLYSKQPFLDVLKEAGISFILVAKPTDHTVLFQWVHELMGLGGGHRLEFKDNKGRRHCYQWVNDVPLNGTPNADQVNFFQYQIISKENKTTYQNSWVTDLKVDANNIVELVKAGRARWKIENETFNTLKNQGYHLEHNFGHGKQNLSNNLLLLNLLAFLVHQILELTDRLYRSVRWKKFTSRKEFWNQLRCTFRILVFRNFEHMLAYILNPPMLMPP